MKQIVNKTLLFIIIAVGLPGCASRVTDWGMDCIKQAEPFDPMVKRASPYIQSIAIYDEIRTEGMFDALWLSDSVRAVYADLFGFRRGKNDEFISAFLRRQIEENKHFISFFVLSPYEFKLGDAKSSWMVFLEIDDKAMQPLEVKTVELEQEYQSIFGKKFSRFKEAYIVKFDVKDAEEKPVLSAQSERMQLIFRSLDKEASLVWDLPEMPNLLPVVQVNTQQEEVV